MYINNRIKKIIIAVVVIFFLLTIAVFQFNQNKNYNATKNELLTQTNTWKTEKEIEDEYKLKTINLLQKLNTDIPDTEWQIKELEKRLETQRLKRRCFEYELERIVTNKGYTPWFCDKEENLEQFKVTKQVEVQTAKAETQTVVF